MPAIRARILEDCRVSLKDNQEARKKPGVTRTTPSGNTKVLCICWLAKALKVKSNVTPTTSATPVAASGRSVNVELKREIEYVYKAARTMIVTLNPNQTDWIAGSNAEWKASRRTNEHVTAIATADASMVIMPAKTLLSHILARPMGIEDRNDSVP